VEKKAIIQTDFPWLDCYGTRKNTNTKFGGGAQKYYKGMTNQEILNFKSEIDRGSLPASAKIGGLIEIHGNGGKGIDWTEGCVALTDKQMDVVYKIAKVGTPVTIVGSIIELKEIVER